MWKNTHAKCGRTVKCQMDAWLLRRGVRGEGRQKKEHKEKGISRFKGNRTRKQGKQRHKPTKVCKGIYSLKHKAQQKKGKTQQQQKNKTIKIQHTNKNNIKPKKKKRKKKNPHKKKGTEEQFREGLSSGRMGVPNGAVAVAPWGVCRGVK